MDGARTVAVPTVHLVGPGKLRVVNRRLTYSSKTASPLRLDPRALRTVLCYGAVTVTESALRLLFAHDVQVS